MSIRKDHRTGKWKVDLQLKRGGKRYRRTYDTKADCNQFVNFIKGQTHRAYA